MMTLSGSRGLLMTLKCAHAFITDGMLYLLGRIERYRISVAHRPGQAHHVLQPCSIQGLRGRSGVRNTVV